MTEVELKLELDAAQEKLLRTSTIVKQLSEGRARTETLHSIYYDTPTHELQMAGVALRLRRAGRRWIQTVKRANGPIVRGLSTPLEDECPAPAGRLAPERIADDDLREMVLGAVQAGVAPVVETKFRRTSRMLRGPNGGLVELALDVGEVIAGKQSAPLIEAELELKEGRPAELYALAEMLLTKGPLRFSEVTKSERALALLHDTAPPKRVERRARRVRLNPNDTAEAAAFAIMDEGLAHFLPNVAVTIETESLAGPHQIRVALRRLRSALSAFRPVLGREALTPWAEHAQLLATEVGRLRDLDVMLDELIKPPEGAALDAGLKALIDELSTRRETVRAGVRAVLAGPQTTKLGLGFASFLAGRGWIDPSDHGQTTRLAQPIGPFAARVLNKRWKAVAAYGRRIANLTIDERHEMRKELKKLRYMIEAFRTLYPEDSVSQYLRQIRNLQTAFGALNDAAMADMLLSGENAPGKSDPAASHAAGRILGRLDAEADLLWPEAEAGWTRLAKLRRYWR